MQPKIGPAKSFRAFFTSFSRAQMSHAPPKRAALSRRRNRPWRQASCFLQVGCLIGKRKDRRFRDELRRMFQVVAGWQSLARGREVGLASAGPAQNESERDGKPSTTPMENGHWPKSPRNALSIFVV